MDSLSLLTGPVVLTRTIGYPAGMVAAHLAELLSVDQAIAILDATEVSTRIEERLLREAAGFRLAANLHADRDYPPFDKALMDGYALRLADIAAPPVTLPVVGEIAAGARDLKPLEPGECVAIMTGAPLPPGADAVVPIEEVRQAGANAITVPARSDFTRFISRRGSELAAGAVALAAGTVLNGAAIAVAATVGASMVRVYARPRVAVLSTGNELAPLEQTPDAFHIRNSNTPMLMALLSESGCEPLDLGMVTDDPEMIRARIEQGLLADALCVTGGMSMGRHDHVPRILRELGVELHISKLKIKPGKPFVYGVHRRPGGGACHVFGLPGNPVSGFVCATLLTRRVLTRMQGGRPHERWLAAQLAEALPPNGAREFYLPVALEHPLPGATEPVQVRVLDYRGSADLFTLAHADALLRRPAGEPALRAGDEVLVLPLW